MCIILPSRASNVIHVTEIFKSPAPFLAYNRIVGDR